MSKTGNTVLLLARGTHCTASIPPSARTEPAARAGSLKAPQAIDGFRDDRMAVLKPQRIICMSDAVTFRILPGMPTGERAFEIITIRD